ncbi:MAG TPA: lytic transglycosylase domain-containing protein [Puia sp.]|jgi:membrane-bound lytic murein transglycosylase D|nr:lytic transglycosylase domain-containing protein [Puia sp.]
MKRLLLLGIALVGMLLHSRASTLKVDKTFVALHMPIDTSDVKNGINNLFLASVIGTNGAKLNPRAISYVQDFIIQNKQEMDDMKSWGRSYFKLIDGILDQYGLPYELKYLAVIESNLKPNALSWAGAVGPWQLMPSTARCLGLKVNRKVDERKNYYKSTKAAAIYLRDLYTEFGDWLLVIAAYNGGTGNVYRAIKKSNSRDFWQLQYYLPIESRNHVKKFIGTQYTFEGQGSVTTLTRAEATDQLSGSAMYVFNRKLNKEEQSSSKTMNISGKYFSTVISKYILMDAAEFNRYNPDFDKIMASVNNSYDLKLPADKMDLFVSNKYEILNESVQRLVLEDEAVNENKTVASISHK